MEFCCKRAQRKRTVAGGRVGGEDFYGWERWEQVLKMTTTTMRSPEELERSSRCLSWGWLLLSFLSLSGASPRKRLLQPLFWHECPFSPNSLYFRPLCMSFTGPIPGCYFSLPRALECKLCEGRALCSVPSAEPHTGQVLGVWGFLICWMNEQMNEVMPRRAAFSFRCQTGKLDKWK